MRTNKTHNETELKARKRQALLNSALAHLKSAIADLEEADAWTKQDATRIASRAVGMLTSQVRGLGAKDEE